MLKKIRERLVNYEPKPPVQNLPKAAVLLALSDTDEPELIYTLRSDKVSSHGGEVSFPGGKQEDTDTSLEFTALRESQEEIGLMPEKVKIIGSLDTTVSRYNISVTPFVGIIPENVQLSSDSPEIEACFKVPLSFFLKDRRYRNDQISKDGEAFFMPAYE